jgi:hypothetical protein
MAGSMRSAAFGVLMALWMLCLPLWLVGAAVVAGLRVLYLLAMVAVPTSPETGRFERRNPRRPIAARGRGHEGAIVRGRKGPAAVGAGLPLAERDDPASLFQAGFADGHGSERKPSCGCTD